MSIIEIVEKIIFQFLIRPNKTCPLIVGIDGLGGSGKTTLVKEIEQELINENCQAVTFHLDDHIVERKKRYQTGHEEWYEYYYLQWDVNNLTANLFEPLHSGCHSIYLAFYDKYTDSNLIKQTTVTSDSIVLIEGVFLQRHEWKRFYDIVFFLDCPRELRYERVLNRDLYIGNYEERLQKYQRRYWLGEEHYMDILKPITNANFVYYT
ncbi:kinase [Sporosarcina sp. Marseille-Q4943]|uniref:kinase n=1 Tax=Sporosarcina sp. Marseille-Q4943 TaxID=2942204 RepID=UPI00208DD616|nr:kinase [Sporosarcina sp. Marseille-Q4943]